MDPFHAKVVAAASGSTVTALTMTPFDVIKTRLQTQRPEPAALLFPRPPPHTCCQPASVGCVRNMSSLAQSLPQDVVCIWDRGLLRTERVNGFFDAFRLVWRAEGVRGLWKGAGTTLLIGVPSTTCYMLIYDHLLRNVMPSISPSPAITPLMSGILARTFVSSVVSPLELVRTNLQSTPPTPDNPHTLRSVLLSLRSLTRHQGVGSLWRGLSPTLWRDVPFSGIYWASYEVLKGAIEKRGRRGASVAFFSGAVSGTLGAVLTSPFDVLKTRRQALIMSSTAGTVSPTASLSLASQIVRSEGVSALFAGLTPRIAKIAPACGIMIACFEVSMNFTITKANSPHFAI
ncbi:mitochondrial carrier [Rickenella mellea]|uniref:Mitochondrial carrier n=1 Tax=Rickenella mellea TaxID=50990 RepID=A0A4Y7QM66_9AGAM|nr:mitochondrial carrier [Rickenella mellea]